VYALYALNYYTLIFSLMSKISDLEGVAAAEAEDKALQAAANEGLLPVTRYQPRYSRLVAHKLMHVNTALTGIQSHRNGGYIPEHGQS
jgi:hypothetical protein